VAVVILALGSAVTGQVLTGATEFTGYTYENGADGSLLSPGHAFYDKRAGELFVASPGNHRIIIYKPDLTPKFSFPHFVLSRSSNQSSIGEPKMVVANEQGDMLIIDNLADYMDVLDFRGKPLERVYPNRLLGDTTLKVKADLIAIDDQGNVYMSVTGDVQAVLVLDRFLQLKRQILKKGTDSDIPNLPLAMTVHDSLLVVSDLHGTPVIRVYDTAGQYLYGFGGRDIERADFSLPIAIAVGSDSSNGTYFLVADALRQVVKLLDQKGQSISIIGGYGLGLGAMAYPSGLALDGYRTCFVVERVGARVQKFVLQ
jgi:hypothetical protein